MVIGQLIASSTLTQNKLCQTATENLPGSSFAKSHWPWFAVDDDGGGDGGDGDDKDGLEASTANGKGIF